MADQSDYPLSFIEREHRKLSDALSDGTNDARRDEISAARQALSWALDPARFVPPSVCLPIVGVK